MCRSIKLLFNFDSPATDAEIYAASLQFVRKITGFQKPSQANEAVFTAAVEKVSKDAKGLLTSLTTSAKPRNRVVEVARAREKAVKRFGFHK